MPERISQEPPSKDRIEGYIDARLEPSGRKRLNMWKNNTRSRKDPDVRRSRVAIDHGRLADFCRQNRIRRLAFFGSVLRDDFRADSDLDVLVEFEPGHAPGLRFFALERELTEILGRKVDLHTPGFLSPYFRGRVLAEAEVQYAAQ